MIDQYINGKEIEVDAIADGEDILIPGIMEHVERVGAHSGDSISVYPNLSKVTGVPIVKLAVAAMLGHKLKESEYGIGLFKKSSIYSVKVPVFSSAKLTDMDIALGPEMKSTGKALGLDENLDHALYKGFFAAGSNIPETGSIFVTLRESELNEYTANILKEYSKIGFKIYVSPDNLDFASNFGINAYVINYDTAIKWIKNRDEVSPQKLSIIMNVPAVANNKGNDSFLVRRAAVERGIPVMTCMDTAKVFINVIKLKQNNEMLEYKVLA